MPIIVQKYGGSSVADVKKIKRVAERISKAKDEGNQIVVVVSAMGDTTDDLISLAKQVIANPAGREYDLLLSTGELISCTLLAMALNSIGCRAVSLSGAQAGIKTDAEHNRAHILGVNPKRIVEELNKGNVVVVAGFQGVNKDKDVTTLGRGGSDTTAVALAIGLKAQACHIYTDVDGVFTADPRLVPEARTISEIGYEEMLEMATYGARVMHPRAVELGQIHNMPILVACTFDNNPGTLIHGEESMEVKNKVTGIANDMDVAKIMIVGVPDRPGIASSIFEPLAKAGISVDTIVQNASIDNITDLTFTVHESDVENAMKVVMPIAESINARECISNTKLGQISIIGTGMQNTPGYAAKMFSALSEKNINIHLITTSEIRITCIVDEDRTVEAIKALHRAFELEKPEIK
ncbi:MAG: aspartate kinase [Dehalococcoidales bacterium]